MGRSGLAAALLGLAMLPAAASAALVEPPPLPHLVTVFPDRDFVSVEGLNPGEPVSIRVLRSGVMIGTATGAAGADGIMEVNHPGGFCWEGATPNILAHDKVVLAPPLSPLDTGEATTTADVHAELAVDDGAGNVVITGTLKNADGSPIDLGLVEQRIVNPAFLGVGLLRRDIRAVADGSGEGTLRYDPVGPANPDGTKFTVIYAGLDAAQRRAAVEGQTRVLSWQTTTLAGDRLGITIHEAGELGGPGFGGCPQRADYAVTDADHAAVTRVMRDAGEPLVLSGVSQDASSVTVTLSDKDSRTDDVTVDASTPTPANGAQTWSATFTAAQVAGLSDGTLTATGSYTVGGTAIKGLAKTIEKDVVDPGAPDATPPAGTYAASQSVTLDSPDPDAVIHYTANGREPSAKSPVAPSQLNITSTQTVKAIAVDPVGNVSPVATFDYVIGTPAPLGGAPQAGGTIAPGGSNAATAKSGTVAGNAASGGAPAAGGTTVAPLALSRLALTRRVSLSRLRRSGLAISVNVPAGAVMVRVTIWRAVNGKPTGRPLASVFRSTPGAGGSAVVRVRNGSVLRKLRPGRYVIEVTPATSRAALGTGSRATVVVTR